MSVKKKKGKPEFEPGDLVYYISPTRLAHPDNRRLGVILKKSYMAYDPKYSRYDVYWIKDQKVVSLTSHSMRKIEVDETEV